MVKATKIKMIERLREKYAQIIDKSNNWFKTDIKHKSPYQNIRRILRKVYAIKISLKRWARPRYTVLDFSWKNLIVIDACRFDLYKEVSGKKESCISVASNTNLWFNKTFKNKEYQDLIYISANPVVSKYKQERLKEKNIEFFKLLPVWWSGWNNEKRYTEPDFVTRKALNIRKNFPRKRIIVHYLQPHKPFVGDSTINEQFGNEIYGVWDQLRRRIVNKEEVWEAYKGNLEFVLDSISKLVKKLEGRTVLTSDHGNMVGEKGFYGHAPNIRLEGLVKVPFGVLIK